MNFLPALHDAFKCFCPLFTTHPNVFAPPPHVDLKIENASKAIKAPGIELQITKKVFDPPFMTRHDPISSSFVPIL